MRSVCSSILFLLILGVAIGATAQREPTDPGVVQAFSQLKASSGGSKATQETISTFVDDARKTYRVRLDAEARLVNVIESSGVSRASKVFAGNQLYKLCDEDTIPAFERMLGQSDTWDIACRGLARIRHSRAQKALLEAVSKSRGEKLICVIEALGDRRDKTAVPVLRQIADEADIPTTEAALTALSKIPGRESVEALDWCRSNLSRQMRPAATDAYVDAAFTSLKYGDRETAIDAFEALMIDFEPADIKARGLRGLIRAYGEDAVPTIVEALTSGIPELEAVAAEEAKSVPGRKATEAFMKAYANLQPDNQAVLLHALGVRGDEAALDTLILAAQSRIPVVRLAAIEALGKFNHPNVLQVLLKVKASGSEHEQELAAQALDALDHPGINDELLVAAMNADNGVRAESMKMIGARNVHEGVPVAMRVASRDVKPVRLEALKALGQIGTVEELPAMVSMLLEDWADADRAAIGQAVICVAQRAPAGKARTEPIARGLTGSRGSEDGHLALVSVLRAVADDSGLGALDSAARGSTPRVQLAAVETLSAWPSHSALDPLERVARDVKNPTIQSLAVDGALNHLESDTERDPNQRLKYYERLAKVAQTTEQKARIANALAAIGNADSEKLRAKLLQEIGADQSVTSRAEPVAN